MNFQRKKIIPVSIPEQYNFEHVASGKKRAYIRHWVFRDHITSNDYEDSLIVDCRLFDKKIFVIKNKHSTNDLHYKILACIDPAFGWETLKDQTTLSANSQTYEWCTEPWTYVKIQVKSAVTDAPALCDAIIACQG